MLWWVMGAWAFHVVSQGPRLPPPCGYTLLESLRIICFWLTGRRIWRLAGFYGFLEKVLGFPGGSVIKNLPDSAGDVGLIPESGRSPGEGNGNPLQYSRLGNPMDRGAWRAAVYGVTTGLDRT